MCVCVDTITSIVHCIVATLIFTTDIGHFNVCQPMRKQIISLSSTNDNRAVKKYLVMYFLDKFGATREQESTETV